MSEREFELYLSLMSKLLRLGPQQTAAIADELRDHFDERFEELCRQGVPREQAIRQALDEFGDAAGLATDFTQLARTRRRKIIMRSSLATTLCLLVAIALLRMFSVPEPFMGPPVAQAQAEKEAPVEILEVPEPVAPTTIDPVEFVPEPLTKKLTWEFTDLPLSEMVDEFARRVDMTILMDDVALTDLGIPHDEPVSGRITDAPAYLLLDRLGGPLGLDWYFNQGLAIITSEEKAKERLTMRSHVFTDLRQAGYEPDALIQLIQNVTKGPWATIDGLGGSLTRVGDVIFVRQSDRMHREVAALLNALRNHTRETYVLNPPIHQSIRERLQAVTSVDFDAVPLEQVVRQLGDDSGIDMQIDEVALTAVGIPKDEPITFALKEKPLAIVLQYLLEPLELTAIPIHGQLAITTTEKAESTMTSSVHDVSDVCQSKDETDQLSRAILNETEGPWEDIDGIGGVVVVPVSGIMVVRQTERVLREVRELLAAYRQAVAISGPVTGFAAEMEKVDTRFYRMDAAAAQDLQRVLPQFIRPETWLGWNAEGADRVGSISIVASDARIEKLSGRAVTIQAQDENADKKEEKPPVDELQPDVLVVPQAVLIIKHTASTHREIERFLNQIKHANPAHAGKLDTSGIGGGLGGAGGGFFQTSPAPMNAP